MTLPSLPPVTDVGVANLDRANQRDEATLRRMAIEFEALLLTQLTASLSPKEDDEEGLFSSSGGMGLSRQMFSEQIAIAMANNGGIGLADFILTQFKANSSSRVTNAAAAAREIREVKSGGMEAGSPSIVASIANASPVTSESVIARMPSDGSATVKLDPMHASRSTRPRRVHAASSDNAVKTVQPSAGNSAATFVTLPGSKRVAFHSPVQGALRSVFGPRVDPINGRHRFHKGIDIAVPMGTPVGAAAAGKVVFAGRNGGYGNMVLIEHADGRRTLYGHNQKLLVKAGDMVQAGQTIAAAGSTGHSKGPHVHFEVRENNQAVNPLKFLPNDFMLTRR